MQPPVEKAKFDLMPITLFFFLSLPVSSYRFSNAFTASNYLYVTSIELLKLSCLRGSWLRLSEVDAVHTQASSLQAPMYCCHSLLRMDHYLALTTLHLKVIKYGHSQWYKCLQRGPGGVFITHSVLIWRLSAVNVRKSNCRKIYCRHLQLNLTSVSLKE